MVLDPLRDEEERTQYELQRGYELERQLEQWMKAVELCIAGGFLSRGKFDEALRFVQTFHK